MMNEITLSSIVLCVICILLIIILGSCQREPHFYSPDDTNKQPINQTVDLYNSYANSLVNLSNKFMLKSNQIRNEANLNNDTNSLKQLEFLIKKYNSKQEYILERLAEAKNRIMDHNNAAGIYILTGLTNEYELLEKIINNCNFISVTKNETKEDVPIFNSKVINSYFEGCKTKEEIEKRYKALAKVFHPDNQTGNQDIYIQIQDEYKKIMKEADL